MTTYTRADLNKEAAVVARDIRLETGKPASVKGWTIKIDSPNIALIVEVYAYDGIRQRYVAI